MSIPVQASDPFPDLALLARAYQLSRMVQVAVSLGVADQLADGPQSAAALAAACGADAPMLLRLCRALAAFGLFTVDAEGLVSQNSRSAQLRRDAVPTLYHAVRYWAAPHVQAGWGNLEHAVRTGEPAFEGVFGMPKFDYLKQHPDEAELFDLFMQHSPEDRHAAVVAAYDFSGAQLVTDVGGGNGALLNAILTGNPGVSGLLFDQAAVVARASSVLAAHGGRLRAEAGSFFGGVPSGGDVYLLSRVLHDWDDAHALSILANIRAAMTAGARLLVIEQVLDPLPGRTNPMTYLSDMSMMMNLRGRERTLSEFEGLFTGSGFGAVRVFPTSLAVCILETHRL
jgi:O-methyltransferase domain/Dimerisation domain